MTKAQVYKLCQRHFDKARKLQKPYAWTFNIEIPEGKGYSERNHHLKIAQDKQYSDIHIYRALQKFLVAAYDRIISRIAIKIFCQQKAQQDGVCYYMCQSNSCVYCNERYRQVDRMEDLPFDERCSVIMMLKSLNDETLYKTGWERWQVFVEQEKFIGHFVHSSAIERADEIDNLIKTSIAKKYGLASV